MKKLDVSLHADEPLGAGLQRITDKLVESISDHDLPEKDERGEYVHTVRTTIKRLRALLRLIRPVTGDAFFDRENERLRRAARRLAAARDVEVSLQTLKGLSVSGESKRKAIAAAVAGLEEKARPQQNIDAALNEVWSDLEQTKRNLHRRLLAHAEWQLIESGLRDVYRQSRKRMEAAFREGEDEGFHKWRIRVKNLYYELKMLEPVWPKRIDKMTSRLSKLQDKIGLDHDVAVLKGLLRQEPEAFGGTEVVERVVRCLNEQSQQLRRASEPLGRRIFTEKPRRFVRKLGRRWVKWRKRDTVDLLLRKSEPEFQPVRPGANQSHRPAESK
jgi:CHAD domain-containing protein